MPNFIKIVLLVLLVVLAFLCWFMFFQPKPPIVTPTPTKTNTLEPTKTPIVKTPTPTLVVTETVEPITPTFTPTVKPTKTPTPSMLIVNTGYKDGWLHYRPGPSKSYIPLWVTGIGAVQEGTELKFLDCPNVTYAWVHVVYKGYNGYVYGDYLNHNPCK
jgi:hypothetical protein